MSRMPRLGVIAVLAACGSMLCHEAAAQTTERVSVATGGTQATGGNSLNPAISANGRFVAFESIATNLLGPGNDTNGASDVFVHDRQTKATTRVSVGPVGTQSLFGEGSFSPSISADGRYVAFESVATNLIGPGNDTNGARDVFVHDRVTGTTERVSVDSNGNQATGGGGNIGSSAPSISADGRYVAFESGATNLLGPGNDTNGASDIFVHDRQTKATKRVSVTTGGAEADSSSIEPSISADGRYVAFRSNATNLLGPDGDKNGVADIFVRDTIASTTTRVSVGPGGAEAECCSEGSSGKFSSQPSISGDGRYVAFQSFVSNLVVGDTNKAQDAFMHDRQTGATTRVSVGPGGAEANGGGGGRPSISGDGRYVAFTSGATNLVDDDTSTREDIFVRDTIAGTTTRVSVDSSGAEANGPSTFHAISGDGRFVAFRSSATNLVDGDTNNRSDIFVRDRGPQPGDGDDLLVDFGGRGLYQFLNDDAWENVNGASPMAIATGDLDGSGFDEAIASFPGTGVRARYDNAGNWKKLHNKAAKRIITADLDGNGKHELIADFGAGGLKARFNNKGAWKKLHKSGSKGLAVGDFNGNGKEELIAALGSKGLRARKENGTWVRLNTRSPKFIAAGDLDGNGKDELIADFGRQGLQVRYNNKNPWKKLRGTTQGVAVGDLDGNGKGDLIVDLGGKGLRVRYNNAGGWKRIDTRSPRRFIAADLDGNGKDEVIADHGSAGLWARYNNKGKWKKLRNWAAQDLAAGGFD